MGEMLRGKGYAGSQSLRLEVARAAQRWGTVNHYVGYDTQGEVFSHAHQGWVVNEEVDLMEVEPAELWEKAQQVIRKGIGAGTECY